MRSIDINVDNYSLELSCNQDGSINIDASADGDGCYMTLEPAQGKILAQWLNDWLDK